MSDLDKVKDIIEKAVKTNGKAIEMQINFSKDFTRRQGEALATLADQRLDSLKEMASSDSVEKAIANNAAFEQQAKESLETLHSSNMAAFEEFSNSLKSFYSLQA